MLIKCFGCGKEFNKDNRHINENIKLGLHNYCSLRCLAENRKNRRWFVCSNPNCLKKFERVLSGTSDNNYCSRSCSVSVNNRLYPKRIAVIKECLICKKKFKSNKTYCSAKCKFTGQKLDGSLLIEEIKEFYKKHKRIPFKRELKHYHSVRSHFKTWNNAVITAGLTPNPVLFANKHIAKDGHKCDSLSEMIVDNWLFVRKIKHEINFPYPGYYGFTVDFKVGKYWIEFFGLAGEHKRYDELREKKINLAKEKKLKLIEIYPSHLFPENKLDEILGFLV